MTEQELKEALIDALARLEEVDKRVWGNRSNPTFQVALDKARKILNRVVDEGITELTYLEALPLDVFPKNGAGRPRKDAGEHARIADEFARANGLDVKIPANRFSQAGGE